MIASLMMYQRPELIGAHDRFWALIRDNLARVGVDAPVTLSQTAEEFSVWTDPELVLSQTCGMPYRTTLHDRVQLVGTPDYGLDGCAPGYYRSAIVVRADDPRADLVNFADATFAYNQTISQSGYAAPYWHARARGMWFENRHQTGAHLKSARAVATGQADIAALDAVTWRNIGRFEGFAKDLRVLDWTDPTPGLPLITAPRHNASAVFDTVQQAIRDLSAKDATDLGLKGIVRIPKAEYLALKNPLV